jgi:Mg2+ and Co2+ transporter CorA
MESEDKEKVPVFRKWWQWYALVIGFLAALIVFFYFFTKYFE